MSEAGKSPEGFRDSREQSGLKPHEKHEHVYVPLGNPSEGDVGFFKCSCGDTIAVE